MLPPPPRPTLFPYTTLFRSSWSWTATRRGTPRRGRGSRSRSAREDSCTEVRGKDRKSTRLNSSHMSISYAVFCLKKKKMRLEAVWHVTTDLDSFQHHVLRSM